MNDLPIQIAERTTDAWKLFVPTQHTVPLKAYLHGKMGVIVISSRTPEKRGQDIFELLNHGRSKSKDDVRKLLEPFCRESGIKLS